MNTIFILVYDKLAAKTLLPIANFSSSLSYMCALAKEFSNEIYILFEEEATKEVKKEVGEEERRIKTCAIKSFNYASLFSKLTEIAGEKDATFIFSFADTPLLSKKLLKKTLEQHTKYFSDYTYTLGYPIGFGAEVIRGGAIKLLNESVKNNDSLSNRRICREAIYSVIEKEINSYEIETVISEEDFRSYRLSFTTNNTLNYKTCLVAIKALEEKYKENYFEAPIEEVMKVLFSPSNIKSLLCTVPSFFNIEVTNKSSFNTLYLPSFCASNKGDKYLSLDNFNILIKKIASFNENAIISLSLTGEPLLNPQILPMIKSIYCEKGLRLYLETSGEEVTKEFCLSLKEIVDNAADRVGACEYFSKICIVVRADSVTAKTYNIINNIPGAKEKEDREYNKMLEGIKLLKECFPSDVYLSFTRIPENEAELEEFYKKESKEGECYIISKVENYLGRLPIKKSVDLCPLTKPYCYHARRDFNIRLNGEVPLCKMCISSDKEGGVVGNAFTEDLSDIYKKFNLIKECEDCDEYYTFNF